MKAVQMNQSSSTVGSEQRLVGTKLKPVGKTERQKPKQRVMKLSKQIEARYNNPFHARANSQTDRVDNSVKLPSLS